MRHLSCGKIGKVDGQEEILHVLKILRQKWKIFNKIKLKWRFMKYFLSFLANYFEI